MQNIRLLERWLEAMEQRKESEYREDLTGLCAEVRRLIAAEELQACEGLIRDAMSRYPHAPEPEPHNLIGILLEKRGDHAAAIRHFRAAWVLDPTYMPARQNLDSYGTFFSGGRCAYDEDDCLAEGTNGREDGYKVEYDAHGVGRVVGRD